MRHIQRHIQICNSEWRIYLLVDLKLQNKSKNNLDLLLGKACSLHIILYAKIRFFVARKTFVQNLASRRHFRQQKVIIVEFQVFILACFELSVVLLLHYSTKYNLGVTPDTTETVYKCTLLLHCLVCLLRIGNFLYATVNFDSLITRNKCCEFV